MVDHWRQTMRGTEQDYKHLADLYWLAFLLTGDQEVSVAMVIEEFESLEDSCALRCPSIRAKMRKSIIEKALTAVGVEAGETVSASSSRSLTPVAPTRAGRHGVRISWEQLKAALLHLDLFSRRILLLTVFQGYTLQEAAGLLTRDVTLVADVRSIALLELTRFLLSFTTARGLHSKQANLSLFMEYEQ
jgi:hypothetical protein